MNVEKVMEILSEFESQAIKDINLDKAIDTDNYESVGRYKLIGKIKKAVGREFHKDDPSTSPEIILKGNCE